MLGNLDAFLTTNPTNIRYLTGFVGVAEHEREAYLLLLKNEAFFLTTALYKEQALSQLLNCYITKEFKKPITLIEISKEKQIWKRVKVILDSISSGRAIKVGFEEDDLKISEFNTLRKELKGVTLIPTKNHIEEMRMIKREDEIEYIREATRITDECFTYILGKLKLGLPAEAIAKAGVTESQIAWEIESFIRKSGAELSFSPVVAFGKNTSQPHYNTFSFARPGLAKLNLNSLSERSQSNQGLALKSNDIILLDFGARVNGYCADMTRVIFVGKPKPEWIRAYETVLRAQESAINYLRAQTCLPASPNRGEPVRQSPPLGTKLSGGRADRMARTIIKEAGFPPYPHSLGHGVGLAIHEAPRLTIKRDATFKPGMVVTIEPGIYIEGQYGIRIEDLLLIKENDIEILSLSPKSLIIL